ncbi:hypothetical protein HanXRQr2_Chr03g0118421 [Helianthus annuus]|uniref:Uncharacterized protein n=1 Tax=Helianthus annuus TaxID=4232 RepID=A0A9K3JHD8_HELAN|nr:hypothetical protein HanXRQr2_Chr03g0118421 [Helianthus annuus]KAJ0944304.1 hypothetical protein HanPSC8_Chr03g0115051 [Helianthus annuus]
MSGCNEDVSKDVTVRINSVLGSTSGNPWLTNRGANMTQPLKFEQATFFRHPTGT